MSDPSPVWSARTGQQAAPDLASYGECVDVDTHLVEADIAGSIAHALGLHEAGLLDTEEATRLLDGLQTLAEQHAKGALELDASLEDVHMNVEHALEEHAGPAAHKLHTARSRNDQVALDLVLFTRGQLVTLAEGLHALSQVLAERASEHAATPWPLHTHGLPGQPATLGYLLHAHAVRLRRDVADVLAIFHGIAESPLGSAAGAGTTLSVDPAVPAAWLGLEPPENGLLATGARDGSIQAAQLAAAAGRHGGDLAADLLELVGSGAIELDPAYTTGSSIMPHKANPDGLELARADAAKLATLTDAVERIASGLGLGYHRDLQRAKPPLIEALTTSSRMLGVLANVAEGFTVTQADIDDLHPGPAIATTDAVEALVEHGAPFREAHQLVSTACHQAESEAVSIEDALATRLGAEGLTEAAQEAALAALEADPARRQGPGGPAPDVLAEAIENLEADLATLGEAIEEAREAAAVPYALLEAAPADLLELAREGSA